MINSLNLSKLCINDSYSVLYLFFPFYQLLYTLQSLLVDAILYFEIELVVHPCHILDVTLDVPNQ